MPEHPDGPSDHHGPDDHDQTDDPNKLAAIRQALCCTRCDYNLRGLAGDVVTCPECGTDNDVASMIRRYWTGPWWKAPGFSDLASPIVVVFVLGGCPAPCVLPGMSNPVLPGRWFDEPLYAWSGFIAICWLLTVGLTLLAHGRKVIGDMLLLHIVFVLMLGGGAGLALSVAAPVHLMRGDTPIMSLSLIPLIVPLSIGAIWLARVLQRSVGVRCVRRSVYVLESEICRGDDRER